MKIVKLRFQNLNSLVGEWEIDFSTPDYLTDGIFAISGPTGSGKSTILDAICLALYGRTPRLEKVSQSTNEIMSRQTGECFSEVLFETNGKRYYSHWSQHRARRKVDGKLAPQQHEISDDKTGKILTSKILDSASLIVELSGMDFDRFTQSMMLAQGNFAAFLKASGDDRAPILEQITGTEIYSEISKRVFEQQREKKDIINQLKAASEEIHLISEEEEKQVLQEIAEIKEKEKSEKKAKGETSNAINWLNKIESLNKSLIQVGENKKILKKELEAFEPQQKILKDAIRAAEFEGEYASIQALVNQQKAEVDNLHNLQAQLPSFISKEKESTQRTEANKKNLDSLQQQEEKLRKLLKKVRAHDQELRSKQENIAKLESTIKNITNQISHDSKEKKAQEKNLKKLSSELQDAQLYIDENKTDEQLLTEFTGINAEIKNLIDLRKKHASVQLGLNEKSSEQKRAKKDFEQIEKKLEEQKLLHKSKTEEISQQSKKIEKLLNGLTLKDYRDKKDKALRKLAEIKRVKSFDEERKSLQDNQPCPICGATHHPYAEGNMPEPSQKEKELDSLNAFIFNIEKLEATKQKLLEDEVKLSKKLSDAEHDLKMIGQKNKDLENNLAEAEKEFSGLSKNLEEKIQDLLELLTKYGLTEVPQSSQPLNNLLAQLNQRKLKWEENQKIKQGQEAKINECKSEISNITTKIKQNEGLLRESKKELNQLTELANELITERKRLFGDKDCDHEERLFLRNLKQANEEYQNSVELYREAKSNLESTKKRIDELTKSTSTRQVSLSAQKENFHKELVVAGFNDENEFVKARLSKNEKELLNSQAKNLDTQKIQLETLQKENEAQLKVEKAKKITEKQLDVLQAELTETEALLEKLGKEIGALEQRIKDNEAAKVRGLELRQKMEIQQTIFERWDKLNTLIGSSDGKKYRNFAQGLTFELVVAYANRQLSKLSDRYILIRDNEKPLDLNVIDNYQAGEVRSTKNLSGGESFIVSLALALGLSQMSSKNVRVDSLFLDEGFGTLDEDTLETALGTLASLRQDGKTIGLISHVGALKDRISTQILVQPIREGRSILSGPGCRKN